MYWPILVAIPFWGTIFPTTLVTKPPEYLELPEPLRLKQLHHFHTCPSQGQTQALLGSLRSQTPVADPHVEVVIKPQLKPRGSVAKGEDPKPSHQLYKLKIKSTRSTKQTLCLWNIQKVIESSHKRKCSSILAWRTPSLVEKPGKTQSTGSRVRHD